MKIIGFILIAFGLAGIVYLVKNRPKVDPNAIQPSRGTAELPPILDLLASRPKVDTDYALPSTAIGRAPGPFWNFDDVANVFYDNAAENGI
jgi:hypothetical protein